MGTGYRRNPNEKESSYMEKKEEEVVEGENCHFDYVVRDHQTILGTATIG